METVIKLRISRVGTIGSKTRLELAYNTPSGFIAINDENEYITQDEVVSGAKSPKVYNFEANQKFREVTIDLTGLDAQKFTNENRRGLKEQRLYDTIMNHPFVKSEGRDVTRPRFEIVDEFAETNRMVAFLKKKAQVFNHVNTLNNVGLNNLCAYLSVPVNGKTAEEIYVSLLREDGFIFDKKQPLVDKVLSMGTDEDAELIINVNKAVILGLITRRGISFEYMSNVIADDEKHLYKYFRDNKTAYDSGIKKYVQENDKLPIIANVSSPLGDVEAVLKTEEKKLKTVEEAEETIIESLRKQADDLGIRGYKNMKLETLRTAVRERLTLNRMARVPK